MKKHVIGLDIGGTKCAVILGDACNKNNVAILDRIEFETRAKLGLEQALENILKHFDIMMEKHGIISENVISIGISCGGPLDSKKGVILSPPNLYGWGNVPIVEIFEKKYNIKTYIENDANACALAEWHFGAARRYENAIFLTFGTGMGAGLILNGKLYSGANGMAGEVGHIRMTETGPVGYGKAGSFEGYCSGGGIAQIAKTKVLEQLQVGKKPNICQDFSEIDNLTAKSVAIAASKGDDLAIEIYNTCAYYLGRGLSILIDILNPDVIVIGSVYARSEHLLINEMEKVIAQESIAFSRECCKIIPAELGDKIGDYAAISVAMENAKEKIGVEL